MQQPSQPQMAFPNQDQNQYQQPAPPSHQPGPIEPNSFAGQQPFHGQMNTPGAAAAAMPQQPSMQQQTFKPQQPPHSQMLNPQPQHQSNMAPPLAQGQKPAVSFGQAQGGPSVPGNGVEAIGPQESNQWKQKLPFKNRNLWVGGQSIVGRKGKDGEWMEVRCSVM
jgi:hypothetical protein